MNPVWLGVLVTVLTRLPLLGKAFLWNLATNVLHCRSNLMAVSQAHQHLLLNGDKSEQGNVAHAHKALTRLFKSLDIDMER